MKNNRLKSLFSFRLTRSQFFAIVSLGVLGFALAVFAFISLRYLEKEKIHAELKLAAENVIKSLQERIDDNVDEIVSMESFYFSSEYVTRDEFAKFTQSIMRHEKGIQENIFHRVERVSLQQGQGPIPERPLCRTHTRR